ncbi:hypothetical protein [uncultured Erythrobacter sp.]|uniref:hypothetical protein n=1 Tax=uncultured Erythrobacter sp. TaxID=263913 RepID=UPI002634AE9A|nr:hypothetical protein [uncultured Erythrobacter sp.]
MKIIGGLLGLLCAVSLLAAPAQAQSQQQVVTQFNDSTISRLLLDVGTSWDIEGGPNGEKIYRVSADGGVNFTLSPRACAAETGCAGLLMIAVFTRNDQRSLGELDQLLNRYNDLNPNGKVYRVEDGTVVLQGYINAIYGVSYANAQAQILVFGQELGKLRNELTAFSESGR